MSLTDRIKRIRPRREASYFLDRAAENRKYAALRTAEARKASIIVARALLRLAHEADERARQKGWRLP